MGLNHLKQILEKIDSQEDSQDHNWSGTFDEYLEIVKSNPLVTRNAFQRLYNLITEKGSRKYTDAKKDVFHYNFFDDPDHNGKDAIFGLDVPLMKLVNVIQAAALNYGTEKRVILLHGPVGSAKSTICRIIKKGVEQYSQTPQGAIYCFDWIDPDGEHEDIFGKGVRVFESPMHEEPLLLIPEHIRDSFVATLNENLNVDYKIEIKGDLCPPSRFIFKNLWELYDRDLSQVLRHVRVRRFLLSEADRVGIGTFQPKDEKNQDSTELTGDINYKKIAQYGSDSDPRAFNFDGEFNIANRGIIEFVEVLKLDVAFLYDLLGASQEHVVKPKKFAQTYIDEVIIGHTNEPEYRKLQDNEFMEALRDRTVKIDIPYITKHSYEVEVYKRDFNSKRIKEVSIAPHTIEMAAMWAVLTRLEKPKKASLNRLQKLKLYNGQALFHYTEDNIKELRKEAHREGLDGISPRYIQDKISHAIILARQSNKGSVNPLMILNELESGLKNHTLISNEDTKYEYRELLAMVKQEYEEIIKSEVQKSICSDESALQFLCANYIDNIKAYTQREKVKVAFGGSFEEPDERLMRSIEEKIDIPESRKDDFRREIMNYMSALSLENKQFDFRTNERLHTALEAKLFEDQKDSIKLTSLVNSVADHETQEKIDLIKTRLIKNFNYDEISSSDVLEYVANIFARGDVKDKSKDLKK